MERLGQGKVKGSIVLAHIQWAERNLGPDALDVIERHLPPGQARMLKERILPSQWIPFELLVGVDRAIADAVGKTHTRVFRELGRHSAQRNLTTTYKAFLRADAEKFLRHEALQRTQFVDFGKATVTKVNDNHFQVTISASPCFSPVFCESALGYYTAALELLAVKDVRVEHPSCQCRGDPVCVFDISWSR